MNKPVTLSFQGTDIYYRRGAVFLEAGRVEEAAGVFMEAITLNRFCFPAWESLESAMRRLGDDREAARICSARPGNPVPPDSCETDQAEDIANVLAASRSAEIIARLREGPAPGNAPPTEATDAGLHRAGDHDGGEIPASPALSFCASGKNLIGLGIYEGALEPLTKAVSLEPGYSEALAYLGLAQEKQYRYREALDWYGRAVSVNTPSYEAWEFYSSFLLMIKRFRKAQHAAEKALALRPASAVAHLNMGCALFNRGLYKAAPAHYNAAIESDPGYAEAYLHRGICHRRDGRRSEAFEDLRKAIQLAAAGGDDEIEAAARAVKESMHEESR